MGNQRKNSKILTGGIVVSLLTVFGLTLKINSLETKILELSEVNTEIVEDNQFMSKYIDQDVKLREAAAWNNLSIFNLALKRIKVGMQYDFKKNPVTKGYEIYSVGFVKGIQQNVLVTRVNTIQELELYLSQFTKEVLQFHVMQKQYGNNADGLKI